MEELYNVEMSVNNQREGVKRGDFPGFAPDNGICYRCKENIYRKKDHPQGYTTGITIEKSKYLVTGCPHCNRSYCD